MPTRATARWCDSLQPFRRGRTAAGNVIADKIRARTSNRVGPGAPLTSAGIALAFAGTMARARSQPQLVHYDITVLST